MSVPRAVWLVPIPLLLLAVADLHAAPGCQSQCDELVAKGELAANVSPAGCYVRVCQREARRFYADGRYEEALESLDFVQDKLESSPSYLTDRGLSLYALGRFEEALVAFEHTLSGFPRNVKAGTQRGHTLLRLGRYDDAVEQFEHLIQSPESVGEFNELKTRSYLRGSMGLAKLLKGDVAAGKSDLIAAFKADPRNKLAGTYINNVIPFLETGALDLEGVSQLVAAYEELGLKRFAPAAQRLKAVLARNPRYSPGYQRLAEILRSYEQFDACEEILRIGEQAMPTNVNLRAERLRCTLLKVGPNSAAAAAPVQELKKLQKAHPDNRRVKQVLIAVGYPP